MDNQPLNNRTSQKDRKQKTHAHSLSNLNLKEQSGIKTGFVTLSERKKTDCGWLIFFYMFVIAMIGVSVYGWSKGNVRKLIAPIAR